MAGSEPCERKLPYADVSAEVESMAAHNGFDLDPSVIELISHIDIHFLQDDNVPPTDTLTPRFNIDIIWCNGIVTNSAVTGSIENIRSLTANLVKEETSHATLRTELNGDRTVENKDTSVLPSASGAESVEGDSPKICDERKAENTSDSQQTVQSLRDDAIDDELQPKGSASICEELQRIRLELDHICVSDPLIDDDSGEMLEDIAEPILEHRKRPKTLSTDASEILYGSDARCSSDFDEAEFFDAKSSFECNENASDDFGPTSVNAVVPLGGCRAFIHGIMRWLDGMITKNEMIPKSESISAFPTHKSPLMDLPGELRNHIFEFALIEEGPIDIDASHHAQPGLLSVSKQVRKEAREVFLTGNTFIGIVQDLKLEPGSMHWSKTADPPIDITWTWRGRPSWRGLKKWMESAFRLGHVRVPPPDFPIKPLALPDDPETIAIEDAWCLVGNLLYYINEWTPIDNVLESWKRSMESSGTFCFIA